VAERRGAERDAELLSATSGGSISAALAYLERTLDLMPTRLTRPDLGALPDTVERPTYDAAAVRPGIVHIGLGGFHRAHMARYTHDLMGLDPDALAWGIEGVGLRPSDTPLLATLAAQNGLYTLVEREGETEQRVVIGSLASTIDAAASSAPLLARLADPAIRIVSITVTENGYQLDRATKRLDVANEAVRADLAEPQTPRTLPGILVEAFARRRAAGLRAFTALSCDNIQHNGAVLKEAVLTFAGLRNPALADWIEANARFPGTMVDRITPVPTAEAIAELATETGVDDGAAVFAELFRQWVIEDDFVDGRPDWDRVGAQFVDDVAPFERMKLRLLNASHLAIAGPGQLMGYETIGETISDPLIRRYMIALMDRETGPTLDPVPGVDLAAYKARLVARFANPAIRDATQRVNTDAPVNYLLEPIRDRLATGEPIDLLALALAAWCRRARGTDEAGRPIAVVHPLAELLKERALANGSDPSPILAIEALFGDLGRDPRLIGAVGRWLAMLDRTGMRATLQAAAEEALI
jgi:mannitol 2-dehydrogenase